MKKNKFQLSNYSLFTSAVLIAGSQTGNGQVVYTDIDPDVELTVNESFLLDADGDSTNDFEIRQFYNLVYSSFCQDKSAILGSMHPLHTNASINAEEESINFVEYAAYPIYLNEAGIAINHADVWKSYFETNTESGSWFWGLLGGYERSDSCGSIHLGGTAGDWSGAEYKFAGFRITDGPHEYYGWVRLSLSENAQTLTIHDYALNMAPDMLIKAGATGNCFPPSVSGVSNITSTSARVKWAPVFEATKYQIYYRAVGVIPWTKLNAGADAKQKTISGLTCDTDYEWKIRTRCDDEFSDFSAIHNFSTASCRLFDEQNDAISIMVYPNPAADIFHIDVSNFTGDEINVRLFNLMGEIVFTENYIQTDIMQIDVSNLPKGNYIIKINSDEKTAVEKIIIQ